MNFSKNSNSSSQNHRSYFNLSRDLFCSATKIFLPVHFRGRNGELLSFGSGFGPLNISVTMTVNMQIILVPQNNSLTQLGLVEHEGIFIHLLVRNINKYEPIIIIIIIIIIIN